jgi:hypothetical protein
MTKKEPSEFRIRYTDTMGNTSYITRRKGEVYYFSGSEVSLALSSLVGQYAAELRFALRDAQSGWDAVKAVRASMTKYHPNANLALFQNQVQLLDD